MNILDELGHQEVPGLVRGDGNQRDHTVARLDLRLKRSGRAVREHGQLDLGGDGRVVQRLTRRLLRGLDGLGHGHQVLHRLHAVNSGIAASLR